MRKRVLLALLLCCLMAAIAVQAQSSTNYDLGWHVLSNGGGGMGSTSYALEGTLSQVLAGRTESTNYVLYQGYWYPSGPSYQIYLPIVVKSGS
jgi:hypothetical protein